MSLSLLDNQTRVAPGEFFPQLGGTGTAVSTFNTVAVSSITGVSTINGIVYPPPGSGGFQSSFAAVAIPGNASTVLMTLTPGQWGFNGEAICGGTSAYNAGFVSVLSNSTTNVNRGNLNWSGAGENQPADTATVVPTLNFGDNVLSTIKLIVSNNGSTAGTWSGLVSKLY